MKINFTNWTTATAELKWGVQRAFRDALQAVADGKATIVYGRDYNSGSPCLVNSVAAMLTTGGGRGVPSRHFGAVVSEFDIINRQLEGFNVNTTPGVLSPTGAEFLLHNFGPMKQPPTVSPMDAFSAPYTEPEDDDLMMDWIGALSSPDCFEEKNNEASTESSTSSARTSDL